VSYRKGEDDLLQMIRDLQDRLRRIETQTVAARRNDVRIGDLLLSFRAAPAALILTNMITNGVTVILTP
jgi:hypothetical protein